MAMDYRTSLREFYKAADDQDKYEKQWGYGNPTAAAYWRLRDELVFKAVNGHIETTGAPPSVLEIGVGHGHELAKFSLLGIPPGHLIGIDLLFDRIEQARRLHPEISVCQQDAEFLSFPDESFNIVCQFTCLMHIPTQEQKSGICGEMLRVLKPGGIIIWWDIAPLPFQTIAAQALARLFLNGNFFRKLASSIGKIFRKMLRFSNEAGGAGKPLSAQVHPVSRQDIYELFPRLKVQADYAGLEYGLWKTLWEINRSLAIAVWRSGWFWQHCFAVIEKP